MSYSYNDCEIISRAFFGTEDNVDVVIPDMEGGGGPPCSVCGMTTQMADLDTGELGWYCEVCGIGWCKLGCHGMRQEDWEGWQ